MTAPDPGLTDVQCTACGAIGSLRIETRLEAKPFGTFSLGGWFATFILGAYRAIRRL